MLIRGDGATRQRFSLLCHGATHFFPLIFKNKEINKPNDDDDEQIPPKGLQSFSLSSEELARI